MLLTALYSLAWEAVVMPGVDWFTHVHDMLSLRNVSTDKKDMAEPVNYLIILWVHKNNAKKKRRSETPSCSSTIQIPKRENVPKKQTYWHFRQTYRPVSESKKKINTKGKLDKQKALLWLEMLTFCLLVCIALLAQGPIRKKRQEALL